MKLAELKGLRASGICPAEQRKTEEAARQKAARQKAKVDKLKAFTVADLCEEYLIRGVEKKRSRKAATEARRSLYNDPLMAKRFKAIMSHRPSVDQMIKRLKCDLGGDRLCKRGNESFQAYLDKAMIAYHLLIRHLH